LFLLSAQEENYIKINPGVPELNYQVIIKVQIYDIFIDYTECIYHLGQVSKPHSVCDFTHLSPCLCSKQPYQQTLLFCKGMQSE
jgi:hypothetical protein